MKKSTSLLLAMALLTSLAAAQTVTIGTGTVVNTGTNYPAPYGNYWGGARHQFIIEAAELTAAGGAAGNIVSLGFDVVTAQGAPLQGFGISMGHTAVVPGAATFAWQSGLSSVYGPVTHTAAVGWNTHNFVAPFAWDGTSNVVIETCFNNLTFTTNCIHNQTNGTTVTSKLFRADNNATLCTNTGNSALGSAFRRPNMQITFGAPPTPDFQVNQPNAYMDFDFVLATPGAPAVTTKCVGGIVNACAISYGLPADVILNTAALVPSSAGGVVVNPSAIVNLDLAAGFVQLFGSFAPVGGATGLCPIFFGAPAGTISAQLLVIDVTAPGFISLSQACQLNSLGANGSVTLPNADDSTYTLDLAAMPLCSGPVSYYGTSYTQISVSTNGVVFPGALGNNGYTPSVAAAITNPGSFGIWSDWQSNANAAATIVVNAGGLFGGVDVTYTNVPYFGTTVYSTFVVGLDPVGPRIEGISGLGIAATPTMIVVSQGGGLATDPGATVFSLGGSGAAVLATDMIYSIGTGDPALGGGANNLWFNSTPAGGMAWAGL